jgi:hypothetical protein
MESTCLNCGDAYTGNFCTKCGQKARTHRISFVTLVHEIPHSLLHIEKGFFFTLKELAVRPGKAIREYLAGKRVNHFPPLAYLLLWGTISTFLFHLGNAHTTMPRGLLFPQMAVLFIKYPALMFCGLIPFISFWSWLFNRHTGYNYWENFVLNTYLIAQFNMIYLLYLALIVQTGLWHGNATPMLTLFFTYFVFGYQQFFGRSKSVLQWAARLAMYIAIIFTLLTGLVVIGFMTPWWNLHL